MRKNHKTRNQFCTEVSVEIYQCVVHDKQVVKTIASKM